MTTPHPTKSAPAPSVTYTELPDFETVEQHIYGACRRYITQDMLEPIHNLIRDAIDAAKEKKMELETINKLYLELSQITTATTAREILLQKQLAEAQRDSERLDWIEKQTYVGAGPQGNEWMVGWKGHSMHGLDFRSAIDAANGETS